MVDAPARPGDQLTVEEETLLQASITGQQSVIYENLQGAALDDLGGDALVDARRAGRRPNTARRRGPVHAWLYDGAGYGRQVPVTSVPVLLGTGKMHLRCPHCRGKHETTQPNACPAKPKLLWARCPVPVCRKQVYEDPNFFRPTVADAGEPGEVRLFGDEVTREQAVKMRVEEHMRTYHPAECQLYGVRARQVEPALRAVR